MDVVVDIGRVVEVLVHVLYRSIVHIVVDEGCVMDVMVDGVAEDKGVRQSEVGLQSGIRRGGERIGVVRHAVAPSEEDTVARRNGGQCRRTVEGHHSAAHYRTLEGIGGGGSDQHAIDGEDGGEGSIAVQHQSVGILRAAIAPTDEVIVAVGRGVDGGRIVCTGRIGHHRCTSIFGVHCNLRCFVFHHIGEIAPNTSCLVCLQGIAWNDYDGMRKKGLLWI